MTKYTYDILDVRGTELIDILNGDDGWEFVSILRTYFDEPFTYYIVLVRKIA